MSQPSPLFGDTPETRAGYTAKDIEVLEGLEPVRRRPGMYIGGTDERALHHLFAEVLDNAMDEAVAGHASRIEVELFEDGSLEVIDNGRGIPVDPHPRFPDKSALEVIMTTLHAGGKFSDAAYQTAGGLHGVGVSVVNALSEHLEVEVARDRKLYAQAFERGRALAPLQEVGSAPNRRGTSVRFLPDSQIFGERARFKPGRLFQMAKSKAYLHRGVEIRWRCAPSLIPDNSPVPAEITLHYPNGLADQLAELMSGRTLVTLEPFVGRAEAPDGIGAVEWAICWSANGFGEADGFVRSYCNTIPTPDGGTHELGLRSALSRAVKSYADLAGVKKASILTPDDIVSTSGALLSVFIREPEFQGQTKERLSSQEGFKVVESAIRDRFEHWLAASPKEAEKLLDWAIGQAEDRLKRKRDKEVSRQSATRKLRLPGKLTDCSTSSAQGTELFIVEGDSAGGSAKQARNRATQAILPLRGKILNVASAAGEKAQKNQELSDLALALGVQPGKRFVLDDLRYERIIIMTDADVDGAHIASLLITYFYREMPEIIRAGRLFMAMPPLYKLTGGGKTIYAKDDAHKAALMETVFKGKKVDLGRFKGLGEMMPAQLKETTMNPDTRTLTRVTLHDVGALDADGIDVEALVETLMGRKAELRYNYIQEHAHFVGDLDI
jgi:topoisomerase IV subunit B